MSESDPRLSVLSALCEVAEDQVLAARALDHSRLRSLNVTYSDLVFELNVLLQEPTPRDPAFQRRAEALQRRLATAHARLQRIAGSMVSLFGKVMPMTPPTVYKRNGRLS